MQREPQVQVDRTDDPDDDAPCLDRVAVTGAAGSTGSELCRQIMHLSPATLVLLEIDETRLYELWLELRQIDADVPLKCICDIRDAEKLDRVFAQH
jgi:FlaA1/EpsC-like NDP-sugar epimerase